MLAAVVIVALVLGAFAFGRWSREHPAPRAVGTDAEPRGTIGQPLKVATTTTTAPTTTAPSTTAPTTTVPPSTPTTAAPTARATPYVFPVQGGGRSDYARSHHDYPAADIFAACGTPALSPVDGVVDEVATVDLWQATNDDPALRGGLSVAVVGTDGVRYYGSHLRSLDATTRPGTPVRAGQRLGEVGDTGNAVGTGCHLHFGISAPCGPGDWQRRRGEYWPQPYLDAWAEGTPRSPSVEVAAGPGC